MTQITRRTLGLALALTMLIASSANAGIPTSTHDTAIRIHHVFVTATGRLSVGGILRSDSRACQGLRNVSLVRKHARKEQLLDTGFTSIPHGAWAVRSGPDAVDGSKFFIEAGRETITSVRVGGGEKHRRRIVCKGDRVPVALPIPPADASVDSR